VTLKAVAARIGRTHANLLHHFGEPIVHAIAQVIRDISDPGEERPLDQATLGLVLLAIGDSLAGGEVARACGLPRSAARDIAVRQVIAVLSGRIKADDANAGG
jgi:hypothetical protein